MPRNLFCNYPLCFHFFQFTIFTNFYKKCLILHGSGSINILFLIFDWASISKFRSIKFLLSIHKKQSSSTFWGKLRTTKFNNKTKNISISYWRFFSVITWQLFDHHFVEIMWRVGIIDFLAVFIAKIVISKRFYYNQVEGFTYFLCEQTGRIHFDQLKQIVLVTIFPNGGTTNQYILFPYL